VPTIQAAQIATEPSAAAMPSPAWARFGASSTESVAMAIFLMRARPEWRILREHVLANIAQIMYLKRHNIA
jgi:hypothetical protein